jgi:hypothetical protein
MATRKRIHTATNNHPDKVEKEIIKPEIISLRPAILNIEQARSVVENVTVNLAH